MSTKEDQHAKNIIKKPRNQSERHSRTGRDGRPKKGGAGGKGTWGKPGDELKADTTIDAADPNYDEEYEESDVLAAWEAVDPLPAKQVAQEFRSSAERLDHFKRAVRTAADEYLDALDKQEFVRCVTELDFSGAHHQVCKVLISKSLDQSESGVDAICNLLEYLSEQRVLSLAQMAHGFRLLVNHIDDVSVDVPNAKERLSEMARIGLARGYLPDHAMRDILQLLSFTSQEWREKKAKIDSFLLQYFASEVLDEAAQSIRELDATELHYEVVKRGISLAIDRSNKERELFSILLASFIGTVLDRVQVEQGFENVLERVEDMVVDVPDTLQLLSSFVARAVSDEVLPPAFLERVNLHQSDMGYRVIKQVHVLLNASVNNPSRLMRIWGPSANRPVAELKEDIVDIVSEYFSSGDVQEALRCINELNATYFVHEIVRKLFVMAVDKSEHEFQLALRLLDAIHQHNPSSTQIQTGFRRIHAELPDLLLDAPHAGELFARALAHATAHLALPADFQASLAAPVKQPEEAKQEEAASS